MVSWPGMMSPAEAPSPLWPEGLGTMLGVWAQQTIDVVTGYWGDEPDATELREALRRIARATGEVLDAHAVVAQEWARMPAWLTGTAGPMDLLTGYIRLAEAYHWLAITCSTAIPASGGSAVELWPWR